MSLRVLCTVATLFTRFYLCDSFILGKHQVGFSTTASSITSQKHQQQTKIKALEEFQNEYSRCLSPKEEKEQIKKEDDEFPIMDKRSWSKKPINFIQRKLTKTQQPGMLILLRTGQSEFNKNFTFTGWADPGLTDQGINECKHAARLMLEAGLEPDVIYTSRLKRAIHSVWILNRELDCPFLPVFKSWRLNERHYGSLTGLCKKETAKQFGSNVVQSWRRSLKARPPTMRKDDPNHPRNQRRYADIPPDLLPSSESLLDCMQRTNPLWEYKIKKDLKAGNNVLVVAHANTLRGLMKIIDDIGEKEIKAVNTLGAIPVLYRFDENMKPIPPDNDNLSQIHTSGVFLEKPGLLEKALERQSKWEGQAWLGPDERKKRSSTLEESLTKLKGEKALLDNYDYNFDINNVRLRTDVNGESKKVNGDFEDEGEFEEDESWTPRKKEEISKKIDIIPNVGQFNITEKDPVVVLIRHGRTPHNQLALFTGWEDPPLADDGVEDAKNAGKILRQNGFEFDVVYTSWLTRAIETAWHVMTELDMTWLPLIKSWRLNERHYGDLTGKSKKMIANIYGEAQLKKWRRGFAIKPPPASSYSYHYPGNDIRRTKYVEDLRISFTETVCRSIEDRKFTVHRKFPKSESLKDCMARAIPYYTEKIYVEAVAKGKRVLITSHENAIRGILMHLCEIPEEHMNELHIPNGLPLVYNVKRKCISLLDDGSGRDPMEVHNFGSAAQYLFRPCLLTDEDFEFDENKLVTQGTLVETK